MSANDVIASKIHGFPGYDDEDGRRLADEQVRSYMGEALADVEQRLAPLDEAIQARIGDLLVRVGFTNQTAFRHFLDGSRDRTNFDDISQADARIIELAGKAPSLDAAAVPAFLDEVVAAFDARDAVMNAYAVSTPP
jgi:hypothetical protein